MNQEATAATEPKKPAFCSKDASADGIVTLAFGNGTNLTIDINALPEEQKFNLMMHGALQKFGDSFAGAKGDYTIAIAAAQKVHDQLLANQWTASRGSSGDTTPKTGELAQALATIKGLDVEAVAKAVEAATDEQRAAWRKHPSVAAEIARMRAAKAAERAAKAAAAGSAELTL